MLFQKDFSIKIYKTQCLFVISDSKMIAAGGIKYATLADYVA